MRKPCDNIVCAATGVHMLCVYNHVSVVAFLVTSLSYGMD